MVTEIKTVTLVTKKEELAPSWLVEYLAENLKLVVHETQGKYSKELDDTDLYIALGGDGSMIKAIKLSLYKGVPVLGVNFGHLGFLSSVANKDSLLVNLHELIHGGGTLRIEERSVLINPETRRIAINEFYFTSPNREQLINLAAYINDEFIGIYRGDGLLVSSSLGSTAYSLAAGGPILHPSIDAMVITPVCPHGLTNKPIVVPGSSTIKIVKDKSSRGETVVLSDGE